MWRRFLLYAGLTFGVAAAAGVLAVIVATPCTAPFMGAAIGYALAQPAVVTFAVFTALALGLAAPYLALTMQPAWTRILPRPGAWMEVLRQWREGVVYPHWAASANSA